MKNTFLCLITNRWTVKEFIAWMDQIGYKATLKEGTLYSVNDEIDIDIIHLQNLSELILGSTKIYQGVMLEGASLDIKEVEGLLQLNKFIALKEKSAKPDLKLIKDEGAEDDES